MFEFSGNIFIKRLIYGDLGQQELLYSIIIAGVNQIKLEDQECRY